MLSMLRGTLLWRRAPTAALEASQETLSTARSKSQSESTDSTAEEDDESCVICCDKVINAKFVPCGHSATCSNCADLLIARGEPCCFCRKPLNKYEVGKWEGVTGDVGLWPKTEENLRNLASGEGFSDYFRNMFNGNEEAYLR